MKARRQHKRYVKRCEIEFSAQDITGRGISSNLSVNGLFIRTSRPFPPDTIIDITIHLPDGVTSKIKGKVMRASKSALGVGTYVKSAMSGMGVEIIDKDAHYTQFVNSLALDRD